MAESERVRTPDEEEFGNEKVEGCPECGGGLLDEDRGEVTCEDCGLVVEEDKIDHGPEWRNYNDGSSNPKRTGGPIKHTMHDKGLSTKIGKRTDGKGNAISGKKRDRMERLRKWNSRFSAKSSTERTRKYANGEIERMSSAMGVPKEVREIAAVIFKRCQAEDLIRGRSIEGVSSAAVYAACRQSGIPRSLDDVTNVSRVEQLEIGRTYRYISRELGLELEPTDPKDHLTRFVSKAMRKVGGGGGMQQELRRTAEDIIDSYIEVGMHSGKAPTAVAGAALYAACLVQDVELTQKEVSDISGKTPVTIRNRYQEMLEEWDGTK